MEVFETIEKGYMPNDTNYTILVEEIIHDEEKNWAVVLKKLHLKQVD